MMPADIAFFETWRPRALAVLRIVTAYLFIPHGTAKLFGAPHVAISSATNDHNSDAESYITHYSRLLGCAAASLDCGPYALSTAIAPWRSQVGPLEITSPAPPET